MNKKIIVIIGACGLLGKEISKEIIKKDWIAILADIDDEKGNKIIKDFKEEFKNTNLIDNFEYLNLSIVSKESIQYAIKYLEKKYGKIDAVVNTAYPRNKNYGRKFEDVTYEDFCENVNLHLGGYFLVSQQFAEFFKRQGFGNIVNFSSIYGVIAPRFEIYEGTNMTTPVEYAAIKSAIIHLTKYIAKYYKGFNIRINCISPGGILDKQPELFLKNYKKYCLNKGMLEREDIIGTVLFLLSDDSKYINGQNLVIDDGFTL